MRTASCKPFESRYLQASKDQYRMVVVNKGRTDDPNIPENPRLDELKIFRGNEEALKNDGEIAPLRTSLGFTSRILHQRLGNIFVR